MKSKIIFFVLMLVGLSLASCSDDDVNVTFSQTEFGMVPAEGTILSANIEAAGGWTASSLDPDWCYVYPNQGTGNGTIHIEVMGNLSEERTGTIVLSSRGKRTEIQVTQSALGEGVELHYRLPVIFHVLYKDRTDPHQYITPERIREVLENVKTRDHIDMTRAESPLRKADDAVLLDNSDMTLDEQREWLLAQAQKIINQA